MFIIIFYTQGAALGYELLPFQGVPGTTRLLHCDMEAALLHLIFDIAAVLVAEIAEHL